MTKTEYSEFRDRVEHFHAANKLRPGLNGPKYSEGREGEPFEPFFSWSPCECCQSPLGGNRETYVFVTEMDEQIEADICTDCVYFLAYGKLDDTTMAEISASTE